MSCDAYRGLVVHNPDFMLFFQEATPEEELGNLNIGSRPTRRKPGKRDIASMRAIPWIFSWTQARSVLPAWLGVGRGLQKAIDLGHLKDLQAMYADWPFFRSFIDLVQMVLHKVCCVQCFMLCRDDLPRRSSAAHLARRCPVMTVLIRVL